MQLSNKEEYEPYKGRKPHRGLSIKSFPKHGCYILYCPLQYLYRLYCNLWEISGFFILIAFSMF